MRLSEFDRAVIEEFGSQGSALVNDLVLPSLNGRTAGQAIAAGVAPREIWAALCAEMDVPPSRRYGAGRLDPRSR